VIVPIRVFGSRLETSVPVVVHALDWASRNGLRLVNLSLGTVVPDALEGLYVACERARRRGVIIVAAHHRATARSFPAVFENVISVAGADLENPFDFLFRPGEAVECLAKDTHEDALWTDGRTRVVRGNSFAAPIMCGIIALLLERYPDAGLEEVRRLLARYGSGLASGGRWPAAGSRRGHTHCREQDPESRGVLPLVLCCLHGLRNCLGSGKLLSGRGGNRTPCLGQRAEQDPSVGVTDLG